MLTITSFVQGKSMKLFIYLSFLCLTLQITASQAQRDNLSVLKGWMKFTDAQNVLYHHLSTQAFSHLEQRRVVVANLKTRSEWINRQQELRQILMDIVGPFPEKTPLQASVVGRIKKQNYYLEKIIFESLPGFHVTAALFLPESLKGKAPAILYCSGHSAQAFRSHAYQQIILNLVQKGFIVLAFDPVGQGERLEYYDPQIEESRVGGPTKEHSYPGAQCFLIGSSQARYMIWDGIRAIDYLLSRPEVDLRRIGVTGRSGGGTQSAYLAAFDKRIHAAAPECYITNFQRLFESIGPQDAEQNFYHGLASGIDHADLLTVRAPKPMLMITTTRDFFSIQGARETAAEVRKAYQTFDQEQNFSMVEDDAGHESTRANREAMYAFFQKHLALPGDSVDVPVEFLDQEELKITSSGQVGTAFDGATIFSLNQHQAEGQIEKLRKSRHDLVRHLDKVRNDAKKFSGYIEPGDVGQSVFTGRFKYDNYVLEKYFIPGEGNYVIPYLFFLPDAIKKVPVVIFLHPEGKAAESGADGEIEWFIRNGFAVLVPDLIGLGELGPGTFQGDAYQFKLGTGSYNIWFAAIQIARSIVGIQAGDMLRLVAFLKNEPRIKPDQIYALAQTTLCPTLLHAATFSNDIKRIALIEPLISYRTLVMNQYYKPEFILSTVPGALMAYDLPDLAACLAPRRLLMVNIVDQNGKLADSTLIQEELSIVRAVYSAQKAVDNLILDQYETESMKRVLITKWLGN